MHPYNRIIPGPINAICTVRSCCAMIMIRMDSVTKAGLQCERLARMLGDSGRNIAGRRPQGKDLKRYKDIVITTPERWFVIRIISNTEASRMKEVDQ